MYNAVLNEKVESIADLQPFASRFNQLATHQGCLLWGSRVAIPPSLQARILQELHLSHPGIVRMKELVRSYVWWPRIDQDIEKTVRESNGCQLQQKQSRPARLFILGNGLLVRGNKCTSTSPNLFSDRCFYC